MKVFFIEIIVDEAIYGYIRGLVPFADERNELIIAKRPRDIAIQCCFVCGKVDSQKSLKKYICEIRRELGKELFKSVKKITVHDRILAKIVGEDEDTDKEVIEERDRKGKEIIKMLRKKYGIERFDICSEVTGNSRVLKDQSPTNRRDYKEELPPDRNWQVCKIKDIEKAEKEGRLVSDLNFYEAYADSGYVHLTNQLINIYIWLLPRCLQKGDSRLDDYIFNGSRDSIRIIEKYCRSGCLDDKDRVELDEVTDLPTTPYGNEFKEKYNNLIALIKKMRRARKEGA